MEDFSDQYPNPHFHHLPNFYVENGVSSLEYSDDEKEEGEETTESERAIERAFIEDERRRNAPLPVENAVRVVEAMRGISFGGGVPDWADQVPEDQWIDRLRRLGEESSPATAVAEKVGSKLLDYCLRFCIVAGKKKLSRMQILVVISLIRFTGSTWGSIFYGLGNLICLYCFKSISKEFFLASTVCFLAWLGAMQEITTYGAKRITRPENANSMENSKPSLAAEPNSSRTIKYDSSASNLQESDSDQVSEPSGGVERKT